MSIIQTTLDAGYEADEVEGAVVAALSLAQGGHDKEEISVGLLRITAPSAETDAAYKTFLRTVEPR